MMEKLDDFIDQDVSFDIILEYYLYFIPEIIRLMIPVGVLLSGLFTVGKMSNFSELTAIKSIGVSFYRFIIPFILVSILISLFSIYFGGYVVPKANKSKIYLEQLYLKKGIVSLGSNIFFQDTKTRVVSISFFDVRTNQANRISIQEFDSSDITKMNSRIDAIRMKYDSLNSKWIAYEGVKRIFDGHNEVLEKFMRYEINELNFTPEDVIKKQRKPDEMSLPELKMYSEDQRRAGTDPTRVEIEFHGRIAFAFASLVVILFGVPLSVNKRHGGIAIQFGVSILITFIYLVFMKISQAFGKNGIFDPILTAWAANIVFFAGAFINLIRAKK